MKGNERNYNGRMEWNKEIWRERKKEEYIFL